MNLERSMIRLFFIRRATKFMTSKFLGWTSMQTDLRCSRNIPRSRAKCRIHGIYFCWVKISELIRRSEGKTHLRKVHVLKVS
jgi:hypothetical protein